MRQRVKHSVPIEDINAIFSGIKERGLSQHDSDAGVSRLNGEHKFELKQGILDEFPVFTEGGTTLFKVVSADQFMDVARQIEKTTKYQLFR